MNYEIVATLGPTSDRAPTWKAMLAAGATAFRLNTSHLTLPELKTWMDNLRLFLNFQEQRVPLVLDLQGSKWRLGRFLPFDLIAGQSVELACTEVAEKNNVLPVPHADFFKAARVSAGEISMNDARCRLKIEGFSTGDFDRLQAKVTLGGLIQPGKGLTLPGSSFRKEALGEKDRTILQETQAFPGIRYAISYVRDAQEMVGYRQQAGEQAYLIAKIERQPALDEAAALAEYVNEIWLCRGDLGAELGLARMARAVHEFAPVPRKLLVPVFMAGQVLEHMTEHSTPTRSEVCFLYDSLQAGYAGVVLSDETAVGKNPPESCQIAAMFKERQ